MKIFFLVIERKNFTQKKRLKKVGTEQSKDFDVVLFSQKKVCGFLLEFYFEACDSFDLSRLRLMEDIFCIFLSFTQTYSMDCYFR